MFAFLRQYCRGDVLDVGGWDFYLTAKRKNIPFRTWTTLECSRDKMLNVQAADFRCVLGDGCSMPFPDDSFDTVVNIQVLEHVMRPLDMMREMSRVLRGGGYGIFLIPQTGYLHMPPHHYYNFTRFWIQEAAEEARLGIIELLPLGGLWLSMALHYIFFFLQSSRSRMWSVRECRRNAFFYLLYPLMVLYAIVNIPICFFLSVGDLTEAAVNHLVVVRKPE